MRPCCLMTSCFGLDDSSELEAAVALGPHHSSRTASVLMIPASLRRGADVGKVYRKARASVLMIPASLRRAAVLSVVRGTPCFGLDDSSELEAVAACRPAHTSKHASVLMIPASLRRVRLLPIATGPNGFGLDDSSELEAAGTSQGAERERQLRS